MPQVAVVTDTTHYMPRSLVEELGVHEVSLYVTFEGETRREADIVDLDDFYARLSSSSEMPSTSQPSVGDFLAVYEPLLDAGADIVSIHISAGISGTCGAAEQAREQLLERGIAPERIVVLDSATGCAGHGLLSIAAANAAEAGASLREAADRGQTVFLSSHHLAEVEAVCDRVGILRAGRLVEVAGVAELRRLRVTEVTATFNGPAPDLNELADLLGVQAVDQKSPTTVTLRLVGPPGPPLGRLATAELATLQVHEPSLEEIFLGYYGREDA